MYVTYASMFVYSKITITLILFKHEIKITHLSYKHLTQMNLCTMCMCIIKSKKAHNKNTSGNK